MLNVSASELAFSLFTSRTRIPPLPARRRRIRTVVRLEVVHRRHILTQYAMRQVLQSLRTGAIEVIDAPCPQVRKGHLLIRSQISLISAGTERMLLEFGKAGLLSKARRQPEKVRQALDKARTDGLMPTLAAVRNKLDQPLPVGYCNVGTVLEVGPGVTDFEVGDRVISNGPHAEVVCVSKNLCAKVPDAVGDEDAVFTVLGAIGLQGIRLAEPTLGESFVVTGLGLIGLLTAQLLRAHGCRVLGIDKDPQRLELARSFGADVVDLSRGEDPVAVAQAFSRGRGVDGVLITASTKSNEPIRQAAEMCRQRGRIVLVGVVGMEISRTDFYRKELSFQVSCSYGPGRYDREYEVNGRDYPFGLVRWTEQRNFEAVLDALASGALQTKSLITHRFAQTDAAEAYSVLEAGQASLGVLLDFPRPTERSDKELRHDTLTFPGVPSPAGSAASAALRVGFLGAGNFASQVLMPAFQRGGAALEAVAAPSGLGALTVARRFGFRTATADPRQVLSDRQLDAVVIATRHDSHADLVCEALAEGKHVFVEKPLALNHGEIDRVIAGYRAAIGAGFTPQLMVGFNRRFAPHTRQMVGQLEAVPEAKSFIMTVNAGAIPSEHWVHDPEIGGGRIVGEACHFIDLLRFLCGHPIVAVQAAMMGPQPGRVAREDKMTFTLEFADGSFGAVHYLANGHRAFPKERLEVFCGGRILQLNNFRKLRGIGWPRFRRKNLWRMDKGHAAGAQAFVNAVRQGLRPPIPFEEIIEVARVSLDVVEAARTGCRMVCPMDHFASRSDEIPAVDSMLLARSA